MNTDYMNTILGDVYNQIFHSIGYTGTVNSDFMSSFFEHWDHVKGGYDTVKSRLEAIANGYIYRQNEIHARIEFKRPWANALHSLIKFDYLGDKVKLHLMDSRETITGEKNPVTTLEISKDLIINCNVENWEKFFTDYEATIKAKVELNRQYMEEQEKHLRRLSWENAKQLYLAHKDEFEIDPIEPMPYEEWIKTQNFREVSDEEAQDFLTMHGLDLKVEAERIKHEEYKLYTDRCQLGIK